MNYIVAYDITNNKRLNKISKIMLDYGSRLQKSIFKVKINPTKFREMQSRIEDIVEPEEDGVKYYPVCLKCQNSFWCFGVGSDFKTEKKCLIL